MERGGRSHFLLGAVKRRSGTWNTTLMRSWQKSKSWVGKMVNGYPGAGLKKKRKKVRDKIGQSASEARHYGSEVGPNQVLRE